MSELARKIEALLFIASSPVDEKELKAALQVSLKEIKAALDELKFLLETENHGIFLKELAGAWTLETKPELSELVGNFRNTAKLKRLSLSKAVIEVLTIIAYKQPTTRKFIEEIRGVDCHSPIARLLSLGLIKISDREKYRVPIYSTTKKFLELFGINAIENLPKLEEITEEEKII